MISLYDNIQTTYIPAYYGEGGIVRCTWSIRRVVCLGTGILVESEQPQELLLACLDGQTIPPLYQLGQMPLCLLEAIGTAMEAI